PSRPAGLRPEGGVASSDAVHGGAERSSKPSMARADLPASGRKKTGPPGLCAFARKETGFSLSRRLARPSQPALTPLPAIFTLPRFSSGSPGCSPMLMQQRLFFLLVACGVCSAAVSADDLADRFPLSVRVTASHTYLRAGPSDDFYPTERLLHGDTLEVWAVDPAGYCAVRPVSGSFSWLRAADVDDEAVLDGQTENDHVSESASDPRQSFVGVVVTDGAVSRVGSQLNDLRHVAQVRLEAGERVRVLHTVRISEGRHAGLWAPCRRVSLGAGDRYRAAARPRAASTGKPERRS
ncbi:MAG: hypothetical protein O3A37_13470, partial [Planctomycetota bacterium]|nr:hypothetical protein [Planctomycetota bacterium]